MNTETDNPRTVGELFTRTQNNALEGYSVGAQMALASATKVVIDNTENSITRENLLASDNVLQVIYLELSDQGRSHDLRLIWARKSNTGNPTEEAMGYIDSFQR